MVAALQARISRLIEDVESELESAVMQEEPGLRHDKKTLTQQNVCPPPENAACLQETCSPAFRRLARPQSPSGRQGQEMFHHQEPSHLLESSSGIGAVSTSEANPVAASRGCGGMAADGFTLRGRTRESGTGRNTPSACE